MCKNIPSCITCHQCTRTELDVFVIRIIYWSLGGVIILYGCSTVGVLILYIISKVCAVLCVGIPSKFTSLDISEHILAGATGANIVFWDLRKMKQRSDFKDSFNEDVTYIRFEDQITTNLLGCSVDGMINMFDLTQPNEEDAFSWCYKVMESPGFLSTST